VARSGPDIVPLAIAVVAGVLSWDVVRLFGQHPEAWDDPLYWMLGLPLMIAAAFLLGLGFPEYPWRWAVAIVGAQAAWVTFLTLASGASASLLPLGLLTFAALTLPCLVAAYAGQWLRRRLPE
jgi:peptidoglycan/LPS O-acetylase OafA/YrhL